MWVAAPGPPRVMMYTILKSLSVQIVLRSVTIATTPLTEGRLTRQNCCHAEAPSTAAAS